MVVSVKRWFTNKASSAGSHENLERDDHIQPGSNRSFGLVMAVALAVLGSWRLLAGSTSTGLVLCFIAAGFGIAGLMAPATLAPLNQAWLRVGLLLAKVVSPVILGILFFLVFTPIGILMRLVGQRPLALDADLAAKSYWITRKDRSAQPSSMTKQY